MGLPFLWCWWFRFPKLDSYLVILTSASTAVSVRLRKLQESLKLLQYQVKGVAMVEWFELVFEIRVIVPEGDL